MVENSDLINEEEDVENISSIFEVSKEGWAEDFTSVSEERGMLGFSLIIFMSISEGRGLVNFTSLSVRVAVLGGQSLAWAVSEQGEGTSTYTVSKEEGRTSTL